MNISRTDRQNKLTVKLTSNPAFNFVRKTMSELQGGWWGKGSRPLYRRDNVIHTVSNVCRTHPLTVLWCICIRQHLPLIHSCSVGYTIYVSAYTKQDKLNQYLYVCMGAVQGFHKTPLKLLTFKRLRPSLNPAAALWPSHSIILITFCEKAGWRGIIAACWHLFTSGEREEEGQGRA